MNALLICPSESPETVFYSRRAPLALIPVLGRSALDRAMTQLANRGAKRVIILAADRPEKVRHSVREGKPWGVQAQVFAESHDLTIEEAQTKHIPAGEEWLVQTLNVWKLRDAKNFRQWFAALIDQITETGPEAVGMHEMQPGVWIGTQAKVSSMAELHAPCWIGQHAWIAPGSVIGPRTVIEKGACVEEGAEIVNSFVGPSTYVGGFVEVRNSMAWGNQLLNRETESLAVITDAFLLSDLSQKKFGKPGNLITRILALAALLLTSPVLLYAWVQTRCSGQSLFSVKRAVKAPISLSGPIVETIPWRSLNGVSGLWSRWPVLWSIVLGDFNWVGNGPLTLEQTAELQGDFERLWLTVPPGLISLADAEGCARAFSDEARAHAAFYASNPGSIRSDLTLLSRAFLRSTNAADFTSSLTQPLAQS